MIRCFPDPFPDELLYSLWARYSDRVRYPSERRILLELFGSDKILPIVDLPRHIGLFIGQLSIDYKYTIDDFINHHTLFPLYSPFMSQERAAALREQMIESKSEGLKKGFYRRFGMTNSLVSRILWLRYCPMCWQEDRTKFGKAYWHRLHQVPGIEICPLHRTCIENSSARIRRPFSGKSLVSAESILPVASPRFADSSQLSEALLCIAEDIGYILGHPGISLSPPLLREQYRTLLREGGYLTKGGLVRNVDFLNAFVDYYTPTLLYQFNCELSQHHASSSWLVRLVNGSSGQQPPLHHILTMHFLGSKAKDFFCQKIKPSPPFGEGPWPCLNPACDNYRQKCISTLQKKNTLAKGNRPVGIFACTCGYVYTRKGPDRLPGDAFQKDAVLSYGAVWEAKLKELWLDPSITRLDIARFFGMSEGNVKKRAIKLHLPIPRISPYNRRERPRLIRDTQWYRTQWLAHVAAAPEKGITSLRDEAPGLYIWLYENDQDWLLAHRPPSKPWRRRGGSKKDLTFQSLRAKSRSQDWISRDAIAAEAVKNAAHQILLAHGRPRRISIEAIHSHVPQLAWLRKIPDRVPLTIQALEEVVETYEEFAIRRIRWIKQQYQRERVVPSRKEFMDRSNFRQYMHLSDVKEAFESAMTELSRGL